jgi:hypothetical protein
MVREPKHRIECFHCKQLFPPEVMISGELTRPPVAALVLKHQWQKLPKSNKFNWT